MPPSFTLGMFTLSLSGRHHHAERDEYVLITLRVMSGTLILDSDEALSMPRIFSPEELFAFRHGWFDGAFSFLPIGRTGFAVLFRVL